MEHVIVLLFVLCFLSPIIAAVCAAFFYARHRRACPDSEKRISVMAYVSALLVCAVIGYLIGLQYGIMWVCSAAWGGNLCGLAGFFVIGPLAAALAIFCVGGLILLLRGQGR